MESLKLDSTQNRNLNFIKFFCMGLLILWGVQFFATSQTPDLKAREETENSIKLCEENTKDKPCPKTNQTI